MRPKFGITYLAVDPPDRFVELVKLAEDSGFDYIWIADTSIAPRHWSKGNRGGNPQPSTTSANFSSARIWMP